jgi:glutathione peroxidase-family protein
MGVISNLSKENKEDPASKSTIVWDSEANFTVFAKVFANGLKAHQIFRYLRINSSLYNTNTKRSLPLETYGNMFLLDESGNVVKLYSSNISVSKMVSEVKKMLPKT